MPAKKANSKKCARGSHKNRSTKRCRCVKVCRVSGGTRKQRKSRKQN